MISMATFESGYMPWMTTVVISVVTIAFFMWKRTQRKKNFPPGYRGLPGVGVIPFLSGHPGEDFRKWGQKIGPIMSVQMGWRDWVIVNDHDVAVEWFIELGKYTSGRPDLRIQNDTCKGYGFGIQDYSETFKVLKKFTATAFHKYGLSNKSIEAKIHVELEDLAKFLTKNNSEPVHPLYLFCAAPANIVGGILFGRRFEFDDPKLIKIMTLMHECANNSEDGAKLGLMFLMYHLRYFPPFKGAYDRLQARLRERLTIFGSFVQERLETFDPNNLRDMIDQFLLKRQGKLDDPSFQIGQIIQSTTGLLDGATDTTGNTMQWAILYLLDNEERQRKIVKEINDVMGHTPPSMDHRDQMPYTCSFIDEVYRTRPAFPISMLHRAIDTFDSCGYTIPKNTPIIENIYGIHHNPKHFDEPMKFKPERFIDPATGKYARSKYLMPFGVGPRYCLGEKLAEREVFMFITGILQKLEVCYDKTKPLPSPNDMLFGGQILYPPKFTCVFKPR